MNHTIMYNLVSTMERSLGMQVSSSDRDGIVRDCVDEYNDLTSDSSPGSIPLQDLSSAELIRELVKRGDLTVVEERMDDGKTFRRVLEDPRKRKADKVFSDYDLRSKTGAKRYKLRKRS